MIAAVTVIPANLLKPILKDTDKLFTNDLNVNHHHSFFLIELKNISPVCVIFFLRRDYEWG